MRNKPGTQVCDCYHADKNYLGKIGVCWGTKECDPCSCGGNRSNCDFYPEVREEHRSQMRSNLNCPNCGAVITEAICPYCGTIFYDFANIEIGKEAALRLKIGDNLNIFKAVAENIEIRSVEEPHTFYCDDKPMAICTAPEYELTLTMRIVPDERDVLFTRLKQIANLDNFSNPEG